MKKSAKIIQWYGIALMIFSISGMITMMLSFENPALLQYFRVITIIFTLISTYLLIYVKEFVIRDLWKKVSVWGKLAWWFGFLFNLTLSIVLFFRMYL